MFTKILTLFQFLPLSIFLLISRIGNSWRCAFLVGGSIAVMQLAIFLYKRLHVNRFVAAVNLFLIGGAMGLGLHIHWLENAYECLMQTGLLVALLIVGIVATIFSQRGFVDVTRGSVSAIRSASYRLLALNCLCIGVSWWLCGDVLLSGIIPFMVLIIAQKVEQNRLEHT